MNILARSKGALLIAVLVLLQGCVQIASIPSTAHSGDVVVLGIGGIARNWGGEKPRNLQLSITDSANQTFPLRLSVLFQAYPDYRSGVNAMALSDQGPLKLQPYDGAWFITTALSDINDVPLDLAVGPATIHVVADNFTRVYNEGQPIDAEGDLSNIPVQIIPGPPANTNSTQQFGAYDNRNTHFLIRPAAPAATVVGGAHYTVHYDSDSEFGDLRPMVFPVSHNPFVKIDYKAQSNGDGTGTYTIYIYNPSGFTGTEPRQAKQAPLQDLGVHLEYFQFGAGAWMAQHFTLDAANSYFVDIDGNRIDGLDVEMIPASAL